ncbi:MAG: integrase [Deltaproteobacteria bacterium]|nr:MAG: integrase [Deltaproteobacteria bacterium]
MNDLSIDDRFYLLLHKKIMNKTGSAKRRTKKYYKDQYRKTGIIPRPLLLVEKGVMEGRKCSGRPRCLDKAVRMRFIDMVKASCDPLSRDFIFITRKARTIKNYHYWLEQEFGKAISLQALRRYTGNENLKAYLEKPDSEEGIPVKHTFKKEPVFALIQIDGCRFRYIKIRNETGKWQAPQVIETFDTGSRYMFDLEACFEETSMNAVDLFTRFLTGIQFPLITICIRPDNAKGFLNLKRVINALNIAHSTPGGFFMKSDFARPHSPKDKAHLESSHRSLHNFEIRIIKAFEDRIVKTVPTTIFNQGKKETITVTFLDITLHDLKSSPLIQEYRDVHNRNKHYFNENGRVDSWIPEQKMTQFLSEQSCALTFSPGQVQDYMKYGFKKIKATVSKKRTIRHANQDYYVTIGADLFNRHKSTSVKISRFRDKLYIFEPGEAGVLLGEALSCKPFEGSPNTPDIHVPPDELTKISHFLEQHSMIIDRPSLIELYHRGIDLKQAKTIYMQNQHRYEAYMKKMRQPLQQKGKALFNAFALDCHRSMHSGQVAPYAYHGDVK